MTDRFRRFDIGKPLAGVDFGDPTRVEIVVGSDSMLKITSSKAGLDDCHGFR